MESCPASELDVYNKTGLYCTALTPKTWEVGDVHLCNGGLHLACFTI